MDIEQLKKEVEILKKRQDDLEKKIENLQGNAFKEYKQKVNRDDLNKVNEFKPIKAIYFIPLIGWCIYLFKWGYLWESLDRGFVRKTIWKYQLIYMWAYLFIFSFFCVFFVFNYFPIVDRMVIKKLNKIYQEEANIETEN